MKPFQDLNRTAQFRRLTPLARRALLDYDLGDVALSPLQHIQNATWSVQGGGGTRYVLRVHAPRRHSTAAIGSELRWLEALSAEGALVVPTPVRTRGEQLWTTASAEGVPESRVCTLLSWVPGRFGRRRRTPGMLRKIGGLMARLHEHARQFRIPPSFVRPRWDHQGLFARHAELARGWDRLTPWQQELFGTIAGRLAPITRRLGAGRDVFGLIHGDLTFPNVLFHRGDVCPIDFDDCGFGYFLYDMAILLDRIEMRPDYRALRQALLDGYRQVRPLPEEHEGYLDLFLLARWAFLGVCFSSRPEFRDYAPRFLHIVEPKISQYLAALNPWQ
jgi:Ser/Thr protein kinase RdoA (MazF antagonist)